MSNFQNALANGSFQARLNEGRRLTRRFHTIVEQESEGDYQKYAQLVVGPGKMFDHGEFGSSIRLQGLAGSPELERIRMEIANLPPLPRPSMKKPQTGGRKRRATKKARRNMRRQTKKANNMRRQRGGGLKEDALEVLRNNNITDLDKFLFDSNIFIPTPNRTKCNDVIYNYKDKRYIFQKSRDMGRQYHLTVYEVSNPGVKEYLYTYSDY
jgi:hypothetical protein